MGKTSGEQKFDYAPYLRDMMVYFSKNFIKLKPYPKVIVDREAEEGVFIKTGWYDFDDNTIVLKVANRAPKDVLRSFAHELIHHNQNVEGRIDSSMIDGTTLIGENDKVKYLENLESEAYLKGNIFFRKWTEIAKNKDFKNIK